MRASGLEFGSRVHGMVFQVESEPNKVEGGQKEVYSQVDTLGSRYESVNFGAEMGGWRRRRGRGCAGGLFVS